MNPPLTIDRLPGGLRIHVTHRPCRRDVLLRLAVELVAAFAVLFMVRALPYLVVLSTGAASYWIVRNMVRFARGTDVTLTVTATRLASGGYAPSSYLPLTEDLGCCGDLGWKPGFATWRGLRSFPSGLYLGTSCVLPLVTDTQAQRILAAVWPFITDAALRFRLTSGFIERRAR